MKKFVSLALILSILVGMTACATTDSDADTQGNDISDTASGETEWGDFKINESDPKTVAEQRKEIKDAMTLAINTKVVWEEVTSYAPTLEEYSHITAITYDGLQYQGQKTKIFAYVGFPKGASSETPVPAVVLVHGDGGHPYMNWIKKWNDRGYAAIAIETTGYYPTNRDAGMNERFNSQYSYGLSGIFEEEGYVNAPDRFYPTEYMEVDEQWAYHGLSQIILASNILRQDERVDSDKIGIMGISWGGILASQVIGYDNRFAFAIPVYGTAYLNEELHPFDGFGNEYVDALWAAERNLDNAKMPILWCGNNDDPLIGINSYVKSYNHTADFNDKNSLLLLADWNNKHSTAIKNEHPYLFADWAIGKSDGFITFDTQPEGREVNCKITIPDEITGDITATAYYLTKPMAYEEYDKYDDGEGEYLDEHWQTSDSLSVDTELSTVSGTLPDEAYGYYINIQFNVGETPCEVSSAYTIIE